jgi:hypothetical protein
MQDSVARAVHAAYKELPGKGKPQAHEWTMLAGLVLIEPETGGAPPPLRCFALATGTRCLGRDALREDGCAVNDCHAEVLVRRILKRQLLQEIEVHARECFGDHKAGVCALASGWGLLEHCRVEGRPAFRLRSGRQLWLYISDSPCGSSAEYADSEAPEVGSGGRGSRLSGAPWLHAPGAGDALDGYQPPRLPLRLKSGRSDLPAARRTASACCSDKLARWIGVPGGWAGGLVAHAAGGAADAVPLHGIVVSAGEGAPDRAEAGASHGPQLAALHAALLGRMPPHCTTRARPQLCLTSIRFEAGRMGVAAQLTASAGGYDEPGASAAGKRRREGEGLVTLVPCGTSLVAWMEGRGQGKQAWTAHAIVGASGQRGGSGKSTDRWAAAPPVSKAALWMAAEASLAALRQLSPPCSAIVPHASYREAKRCASNAGTAAYGVGMASFLSGGGAPLNVFASWAGNGSAGLEDFSYRT